MLYGVSFEVTPSFPPTAPEHRSATHAPHTVPVHPRGLRHAKRAFLVVLSSTLRTRAEQLPGNGKWYSVVSTADGALHVVEESVDTAEWAIRRARRQAEDLEAANPNHRDCRGGFRDQKIGARCGPANWYGMLAPRDFRVLGLMAVQAPSLRAAIRWLARRLGCLYAGANTLRQVVTVSLTALLRRRKAERKATIWSLVRDASARVAAGMPAGLQRLRTTSAESRLLGSRKPAVLAAAAHLGVAGMALAN